MKRSEHDLNSPGPCQTQSLQPTRSQPQRKNGKSAGVRAGASCFLGFFWNIFLILLKGFQLVWRRGSSKVSMDARSGRAASAGRQRVMTRTVSIKLRWTVPQTCGVTFARCSLESLKRHWHTSSMTCSHKVTQNPRAH